MRTLWAIADLHLPLSTPSKDMGAINPLWHAYVKRLELNWQKSVQPQDVVVIAGDISWAMHLKGALIDLTWLHRLRGTKILVRGNHDFWWTSAAKLAKALPPSCIALTKNAVIIDQLAFAGTRFWSDDACSVGDIFYKSDYRAPCESDQERLQRHRLVLRELERLKLSLSSLPEGNFTKIAITHYPPIGTSLEATRASCLMQSFGVKVALFGHLHNVRRNLLPFGTAHGIDFVLCSADHLNFSPKKILTF